MSDDLPKSPGADESEEPKARERSITGVRRRIKLAEQLADEALAAELKGDHKAAADLYRKAIDALTLLADAAAAAVNDTSGKEPER